MRNILVIGAGRSSSSLIKYLLENASLEEWRVSVGDVSEELAKQKTGNNSSARPIRFDIQNAIQREKEISAADIVISMLPAFMHQSVAKDCVRLKKHLVTASYVSPEIRALHGDAEKAGVILMNEIGLDPGIDHASAMKIIDDIHTEGGEITLFKSYCGGLIAPESNDNPWGYKFTWNPRNVVLAGQGTAQYIENGKYKYIPYNRLFLQTDIIEVDGYGKFEAYANRDSLSYRTPYGLEEIPTLMRGTLRSPGYCSAWNAFVKLGWTDDTYKITDCDKLSYSRLLEAFLPEAQGDLRQRLASFIEEQVNSEVMKKLEWLGIFENTTLLLKDASPAEVLQDLLEKKWKLQEHDRDMIVMQHVFEYIREGKKQGITSSLVVKGEDQIYTAMSKTVGLPAAITAKNILNGKIKARGVQIPVHKEIYEPLLTELEKFGIVFSEKRK